MAFNFNWAPLSGDPTFYKRAEELLTNAMNKNAKPPIIVDDIIVTELNLGEIPPDLEVVEISDIGVDKFRGTFKMSYTGNAYITIKTRVQANPMNTYLVTRPAYTSPRPLAAAAGLTIPLQITLSDFKLSAIIILVFSRQKGLTIVFRNDPLESLKVSSTFDSIPFVANYLQQVIEGQLRTLFMDELPAIIHRMSLRLWVPEHLAQEERALAAEDTSQDEVSVNPLASTPKDPVDATGTTLSPADIAAMSLDSHFETQSLFSRKNLLRLATLTDSHRTLSLFTPNIRDAVFRAWTGPLERGEMAPSGTHSKAPTPALSRTHSYSGSIASAHTFESGLQSRPSLYSFNSAATASTLGGLKLKSHSNRKRRKRIVNLRKQPETGELESVVEDGSTITDSTSVTSESPSIFSAPPAISASEQHNSIDPVTPLTSPGHTRRQDGRLFSGSPDGVTMNAGHDLAQFGSPQSPTHGVHDRTIRARHRRVINLHTTSPDETPRASTYLPAKETQNVSPVTDLHETASQHARMQEVSSTMPISIPQPTTVHSSSSASEKRPAMSSRTPSSENLLSSSPSLPNFLSFITDPSTNANSSIAERAWMMKMAAEVARRYDEERAKGSFGLSSSHRDEDSRPPPPAYAR